LVVHFVVEVATMRPIFVGNFGYDSRQSDLERLFGKYGKIERVDMKSGLFDFDVVAFYRP